MAIEGFQDGGTAVEPTTGNAVPIGSLPNEVADDIPARLSEGEFVLPADVVRFIGLERLMKLRDEAKEGLRRMAEVGQMGNAEDVGEKAEESFEEEEDTEGFESDIDEIMSEVEGVEGQTEQAFAKGGVVGSQPWLSGTDLTKAPKNPVFDVRYYKHPDGRMMYVTFFNGKPMTPIPDGFTPTEKPTEQLVGKEAEEKKKIKPAEGGDTGGGGYDNQLPSGQTVTPTGPGGTLQLSDLAKGTTVSPTALRVAAGIAGLATGIPFGMATMGPMGERIAGFLTNKSGEFAGMTNIEAMGKALNVDVNTQAGRNAAMAALDDLGMTAGLPESFTMPGQYGISTAMSDYLESGASQVGSITSAPAPAPSSYSYESVFDPTFGGALPAPAPAPAPAPEPAPAPAPAISYPVSEWGPPAPAPAPPAPEPSPAPSPSYYDFGYGDAPSPSPSPSDGYSVADSVGMSGFDSIGNFGSDSGSSSSSDSGGGGCFISTAAIEHMNEKDDGEVLTTLRKFRDTYMRRNKEANKDVEWYYKNAPKIVEKLDALPNAKVVYKRMYNQFIKPAYKAVKEGEDDRAYEIYKKFIKYAKEKSGIERDDLTPRYKTKGKGLASR